MRPLLVLFHRWFGLTAALFLFFMTQGRLMAAYGIEDKDKG